MVLQIQSQDRNSSRTAQRVTPREAIEFQSEPLPHYSPLQSSTNLGHSSNTTAPRILRAGSLQVDRLLLVDQKREALRVKHGNYKRSGSALSAGSVGNHERDVGSQLPEKIERQSNLQGVWNILNNPISLLLLAWPLGLASHLYKYPDVLTFWLNFLAMVPLAKILGDATEELAAGLKNDTLGGLLNATFGNAVEMILTVQTLRAGQFSVVKGTLLGSILSNLLLVLGMSFFVGGLTRFEGKIKGKEQSFSTAAALTNMTMLFMGLSSVALPCVYFNTKGVAEVELFDQVDPEDMTAAQLKAFDANTTPLLLQISRICSCYVLAGYVAFLVFQLYSHVDVFKDQDEEVGEEEEAAISVPVSMTMLAITTCLVAAASEFLVDAIDGLVEEWGIKSEFIGTIMLPIVGNACEHAGAIRMAVAEKVDITIGIAVGSSTQISLLVVPFAVVVGWALDQPMDLNFGMMNTAVLMCSVLITFSIISDGSSNWLEGFMLMIAYGVIATLFWF